jgi:PAS domain-containing protein
MMPFRTDVGHLAAELPRPLLRVDGAGRVVWRNTACRALVEGDGPTLLGRPLRELAHPDDRNLVTAALMGIDGGAGRTGAHVLIRLGDGSWAEADLELAATPAFEEHEGFVTGLVRVADR